MLRPDSVNRVRPPNTTIPKTLAALPNSQYATDFELTSGKLLFALAELIAPVDSAAIPPNDLEEIEENLVGLWKKFDLHCGATDLIRRGGKRWQAKKSLDSLGAALRSPGSILEDIYGRIGVRT